MKASSGKSQLIVVLLTVLSMCLIAGLAYAAGEGHGEGHGGADKVKDLWLRIMNFAGLVIILVWALKKPIANGLSSRRQAIQNQFDDLGARKADAERLYKEYEAKLGTIETEVKSIIGAAVAQGEAEKAKIIEEANRAAGDIKRQAEMAVQHELALAKKKLREEIAEQAAAMAEELVVKNFKADDQVRLVEGYLEKVGGVQ